ncbi:MAG: Hsp70 family protein [Caulobacterales bacterium]
MRRPPNPDLVNSNLLSENRAVGDWRLCVDFGTASSKAALGLQADWASAPGERMKVLPLGQFAGNHDPLTVPSALYVDGDRIFFGPRALERAMEVQADSEPLLSFKMLLGAPDLAALLDMLIKRSIDPTGRLTNKHILILYIGYLSALIESCFENDPALSAVRESVRWRYTRPDWLGSSDEDHDSITKSLFETGIHIGRQFKHEFLSEGGLHVVRVLDAINSGPLASHEHLEGSVLEAHAAAALHAGAAGAASPFMLIFDMGAGTTDFAGFKLSDGKSQIQMLEIGAARRSIVRAGDEVDKILMNAFIRKAQLSRSRSDQAALWRSMSLSIREIKRRIFSVEKATVRFRGKTIILRRSELESSPDFEAFTGSVRARFNASLAAVATAARKEKVRAVSVVLAGGGASLPFIQAIAKEAERSWKKDARVILEPLAPVWANDPGLPNGFAGAFTQLEIAIGGASPLVTVIAPDGARPA